MRSIHLAPGEGEAVRNPTGGRVTFKVRAEETDGALTAFEGTAAPGDGPPLHVHPDADEIWYALEGTFRVKLEEEVLDAPAGTFVFIPRGAWHTWQNIGDGEARLLAILSPSGLERFFERFAELPDDASVPEAFRRLGSQAGMDVVGPPLAQSDPL
jgi:quercetin dioxygenase-like cupin family protein